MQSLIRKIIIGTASVIAFGIAGEIASSALDYAADANMATPTSMPTTVQTSQTSNNALTGDVLRRNDIRWVQLELRNRGLYRGSLDGVLGSETRRALSQFQKINGLGRTASLDAHTWGALTGTPAIVEGSSMPDHAHTASDLGKADASVIGRW